MLQIELYKPIFLKACITKVWEKVSRSLIALYVFISTYPAQFNKLVLMNKTKLDLVFK